MRAEQACRPTVFGVTQNSRLKRPASVRWILESRTTEGTCPEAQLRPHSTLLPRASRVISTKTDSTKDAPEVSGSFRDSLLPLWPQGILTIQTCQQGRGDMTFPPQQIQDRPSLGFPGIGRGFRFCCTRTAGSHSPGRRTYTVCVPHG